MKHNVRFRVIDVWTGVDIEDEMSVDGCTIVVDKVFYKDNDGTDRVAITNSISFVGGEAFIVIAIFAHPESGCAWFYAKHTQTNQYVEVDINAYNKLS